MRNKDKAEIVFLGAGNRRLPPGVLGKVAVYLPDTGNAYLEARIDATPYYDTGHWGFLDTHGDVWIFRVSTKLCGYLGKRIGDVSLKILKDFVLHRFEYGSCIRKDHYILVDDKASGFRHIYPYPSQRFLSEHYRKFVSSPQLRNFFFEYHTYVLKKSLGRKSFKGLRVLDVAAGDGSFLSMLRKEGAGIAGFEPSLSECEESSKKGIVLINGPFESEKVPRRHFDVVIAGNIFEHVRNPFAFMDTIKRVLKKGGYLFFQIPNDFNPLQECYLKKTGMPAWFICPPEHLNYWNAQQAREFVKRCGFEVIHEEAQFPIEIFLLFGMDYRKHPELGKEAHRMRCNFEEAFAEDKDALSKIYRKFIEAGIGRDYVAVLKLLR